MVCRFALFRIVSHCLVIVDFWLWSQGSQSGVAARPPAVRRSSGHETGGSLGLKKVCTFSISKKIKIYFHLCFAQASSQSTAAFKSVPEFCMT